MDTVEQGEALRAAQELVAAWGREHYEAGLLGQLVAVTDRLDGEDYGAATDRIAQLAIAALGNGGVRFIVRSRELFDAQAALGAAEYAAAQRSSPVRWKSVGRAEVTLEMAEAALLAAAVLDADPEPVAD